MDTVAHNEATIGQRFLPEAPFGSVRGLARYIAVTGLAGLIAGIVVGGVGGRVFMRIAGAVAPAVAQGSGTEAGFTVGEVTAGGTIALVVFVGIFVGVVGATIFVVSMPWLGWAGRWRGVWLGVVLFAAGSATSDVMNPDNFDFRVLGNELLLVSLIFGLFLTFGVAIDRLSLALGRTIPQVGNRWRGADSVFVAISALGLLVGAAAVPALFTEAACDCDPPLAASFSIGVMGLGTVLWWASGLVSRSAARLRSASGVLGYAGLVGVLVFGLSRAVSDAIEIVG